MVSREKFDLRKHLIDAAETCFETKGVAHTSMLDVAKEAGVSRTTLYKYYPRIEDVLQAAFVREFERFEEKIKKKLAQCRSAEQRLIETISGIAENVPSSSFISTLVSGPQTNTERKALDVGRAALDDRVRSLIDEPLTALSREDHLRTDVDREMIIEWIRIQVHAFSVLRHPGEHSRKHRRELISAFLVRSILSWE
jgi:AcrR family transcriptional regulator